MSEFGKGLTYCLGLFLAHAERPDFPGGTLKVEMWFNGAADHLYELEIPENLPQELHSRLSHFQSRCLAWRLIMGSEPQPTEADKNWAIQEAKDLLLEIDKHFSIAVEKGDWE